MTMTTTLGKREMGKEKIDNVITFVSKIFKAKSDHRPIIITNASKDRLKQKDFYYVTVTPGEVRIVETYRTLEERIRLNLATGELDINKTLEESSFQHVFVQKMKGILKDIQLNQAIILEAKKRKKEGQSALKRKESLEKIIENKDPSKGLHQFSERELKRINGGSALDIHTIGDTSVFKTVEAITMLEEQMDSLDSSMELMISGLASTIESMVSELRIALEVQ